MRPPQVGRGRRGDQRGRAVGGVQAERLDVELEPWPRAKAVFAGDGELGQRDRRELAGLPAALGLVAQVAQIRVRRERA